MSARDRGAGPSSSGSSYGTKRNLERDWARPPPSHAGIDQGGPRADQLDPRARRQPRSYDDDRPTHGGAGASSARREYENGTSRREPLRDDYGAASRDHRQRQRSRSPGPRRRDQDYEYERGHGRYRHERDREDDRHRDGCRERETVPRRHDAVGDEDRHGAQRRYDADSSRSRDGRSDRAQTSSSQQPPGPPSDSLTRQAPQGGDTSAAEDGHLEEGEEPEDPEQAMMAALGFGGFGTTKGKKVAGNAEGAANIKKERTWRQYMNRKGGFNRVLEKI